MMKTITTLMKKIYLLLSCCVVLPFWANSQNNAEILADTIIAKSAITSGRMQLHLMIEREQKKADVSDGIYDKLIAIDEDMGRTSTLSKTIFEKTNRTVAYVENNFTEDQEKRRLLGQVIDNLKTFNTDMNDGYVDISYYHQLFEHTYQVIRGIRNKNLNAYVSSNIGKPLYAIANLIESDQRALNTLMEGMTDKYPDILIKKIKNVQNVTAADIIVKKAAPKNPKIILNYATSTAVERNIVRRNTDPYVQSSSK
jgi:hypothetical protein